MHVCVRHTAHGPAPVVGRWPGLRGLRPSAAVTFSIWGVPYFFARPRTEMGGFVFVPVQGMGAALYKATLNATASSPWTSLIRHTGPPHTHCLCLACPQRSTSLNVPTMSALSSCCSSSALLPSGCPRYMHGFQAGAPALSSQLAQRSSAASSSQLAVKYEIHRRHGGACCAAEVIGPLAGMSPSTMQVRPQPLTVKTEPDVFANVCHAPITARSASKPNMF